MRIGSCELNSIAFDTEISVCKLKLVCFLCLLCVSRKLTSLVIYKKKAETLFKSTLLSLGMSVKFSNAENRVQAVVLYCKC